MTNFLANGHSWSLIIDAVDAVLLNELHRQLVGKIHRILSIRKAGLSKHTQKQQKTKYRGILKGHRSFSGVWGRAPKKN